MATFQVEEILPSGQQKLDLVSFVNYDTWKELLIELVEKQQLDPWNIDITELVDSYISAVKALKVMDLRLPANIILTASILLRMKSSMLSFFNEGEPIEESVEIGRMTPLVEELVPRVRPPVKRRLTLDELIQALDEAMKITEQKNNRSKQAPIEMPVFFKDANIEEEMELVYGHICRHADKEKMTTLSYLLASVEMDDFLLGLFIPLLFLASKGRVSLVQEGFFKEVVIKLRE